MKKEELLKKIHSLSDELKLYHVRGVYIFGSFARDEANEKSDVDIFIDLEEPISLFQFVRLKRRFEGLLNRTVDLTTKDALRPELKEEILREALRAA